jgi:hypothetical protein
MATTKNTKQPEVLTKTGEVRFRDEDGALWVAESFVNANGEVFTQSMQIPEDV